MKKHLNGRFLFAICIILGFAACNQSDKKAADQNAADSAANAQKAAMQQTAPDAVMADPGFYKVTADTLGIRMIEVTYNPGDSSAWHQHPDYAIYVVSGGKTKFYGKDGSANEVEMKAGAIIIKPAEVHSVKNTGTTTLKVILVEVTRPRGTMAWDADNDVKKTDKDRYKIVADTLGIRVLEINYSPGQVSSRHAHPDNAVYMLEDGKAEFTADDGKKNVVEIKKGMMMIAPSGTHTVKNLGKTVLKAILVEVSRPMK